MTDRREAPAAREAAALLRLLQLASPALPVGSFAYSQGMEWAVEVGWIVDEASAAAWLRQGLGHTLQRLDLPILARLHEAAARGDDAALVRWSRELRAARETAELRVEERDRGQALARLLAGLGIADTERWQDDPGVTFATGFALAAAHWQITVREAALAYAWTWLENAVINAVKLVPLGQLAGQRLLARFVPDVAAAVDCGLALRDDAIGATLPAAAIASSRHETQYTRLYRS